MASQPWRSARRVQRDSAASQLPHQPGMRVRSEMFRARHHAGGMSAGRQSLHQQTVGFVAAASEGDDERRDLTLVEPDGVIETGVKDR